MIGYVSRDYESDRLPELSKKDKARIYDNMIKAVEEGFSIELCPFKAGAECKIGLHVVFRNMDIGMGLHKYCYSANDIEDFISQTKRKILEAQPKEGEEDV
ncbi:MAG: hypothetical protein LUD72_06610 [Bacteroidales bacterium]|nr:hypothetical protein [Bacteroidales bacterium]